MSERQETIADIVAEKRTQADRIERVAAAKMASGKMTSDHFAREVVATLRTEADRLEAAAKRERNNAAAMRTVLVNIATEMIGLIETPKSRHACFQPQAVLDEIKQVIPELEGV